MKVLFFVLILALAGGAYLGGFWPERQQRQAKEAEVASLRAQLTDAQGRVRLGELLGKLLAAEDAVSAQNYGQAQDLSSALFDAVRLEMSRGPEGGSKSALAELAHMRDPITASLTRGDPQAQTLLRDAARLLRVKLGHPTGPGAATSLVTPSAVADPSAEGDPSAAAAPSGMP